MTKKVDVTDLPKEQLMKSATYVKWVDRTGTCSKCHEWTEVLSPCCGYAVNLEGGSVSYEDLWDEIEQELLTRAIKDDHVDDSLNGN